jgi:hypothetical protein
MAKQKVKLLLNIGWQDAEAIGLHDFTAEELAEGAIIEVDEVQSDKMVNRMKCAAVYDPRQEKMTAKTTKAAGTARTHFAPAEIQGDETTVVVEDEADEELESPLADANADEAIDRISRMRSPEKLQEVIDTDPRVTVQEAARRRLAEL